MRLIPVIDLKDGVVVHAKQGMRNQYAPIQSTLCEGADPERIIGALLRVYPFDTIYLADLNAITGNALNQELIARLLNSFPQLCFWIDSGYQIFPGNFEGFANVLPVLGSESYTNENYTEIQLFQQRYVLSLDYLGVQQLGASVLFSSSHIWPDNIIIMNLSRVGSNSGPDLPTLQRVVRQYPNHTIIAAGGIRNRGDLNALSYIGVSTALLASALHSSTLTAEDVRNI